MKIQTMKDLIAEMRAVAGGEVPAPADAAAPSVGSAETWDQLKARLVPNGADFEAFDRIMSNKGGEAPRPEDIFE